MVWASCGFATSFSAILCLRPSTPGRAGQKALPLSHLKVLYLLLVSGQHLCVFLHCHTAFSLCSCLLGLRLLLFEQLHLGGSTIIMTCLVALPSFIYTELSKAAHLTRPTLPVLSKPVISQADLLHGPPHAGVASPDSRSRGAQSRQQGGNLTPASPAFHTQAARHWSASTIPAQCLWSNVPAGARCSAEALC